MTYYPKKITERCLSPKHQGKADGVNAVGTGVGLICGSFVRVYLKIDTVSNQIVEARFKTNGCGFSIAAADRLAEKVAGMNLTDLHGFDAREFRADITETLGEIPAERTHCFEMGLEAMRAALADFRALRLEEFQGEKALICTCFGVSEERIEEVISEISPESVDQVAAACNAGAGCGSCRMLIEEMIDAAER